MTHRVLQRVILALACFGVAGCIVTVGPVNLTITPATLSTATEGTEYFAELRLEGADALNWRIVSGGLPDGLRLDDDRGELSGTPGQSGTFSFTVQAESLAGRAERDYTLIVKPQLRVTPALGPARVGSPYDATPSITGGLPPYSVEIVGLPGGLDFDRGTGRVFGTPLNPSSGLLLEFRVRDSDSPAQTRTERTTLVIQPLPVTITTLTLPAGSRGRIYSATLTATNGRTPFRWAVIAGVLPDGLRLNATTGVIFSEPIIATGAQTTTFTIEVTDADSPRSSARQEYTLTISD